jgi:predicted alpha/beta hydrolase family esterase
MQEPTVLIVPGLRDHVDAHWQTLLAKELPRVRTVAPLGRERLDLLTHIKAIEREAQEIEGPMIVVAHSAGTIAVAHWAMCRTRRVAGALLAVPPDFETPMPEGYPTIAQLREAGWLPVPRRPLPFASIVAASRNDPLAKFERVQELASQWDSTFVDLGEVGHLNPASGYGRWDRAREFIDQIAQGADAIEQACWAQPLRY